MLALICSAFLLSAGCTVLPKSDPSTLYRLPASDLSLIGARPSGALTAKRLGIAAPEAGYLLSSNRIVVSPSRNVVNVYEGARWYADAPDLLQARLIAGLQQSQLFTGVGSDHLPSDLLLLSELRHFQSEYETLPPSVKIQLDVQLVDAQNRAPLAAKSFTTNAQSITTNIPDVVDAFGIASDELTEQLVEWLAQQTEAFNNTIRQ
jgi:cholesterol transport system auxiliary component